MYVKDVPKIMSVIGARKKYKDEWKGDRYY